MSGSTNQPLEYSDDSAIVTHEWAEAGEEDRKGTVLMEIGGRYEMVPIAFRCSRCGLALGARGRFARLDGARMPHCDDVLVDDVMRA